MNLFDGTTLPPLDVSRETIARLEAFAGLLRKWTKAINLVSSSSLDDLWTRHIIDSAQLIAHATSRPPVWLDMGSGGGLPGIVVACVMAEISPDTRVTMIESDRRKATFLRTALRELKIPGVVAATRIEDAPPQGAAVISARALAPLPVLLGYVHRHLAQDGLALLQKGQGAEAEIIDARQDWRFRSLSHTSITEPRATILAVEGLHRA